MTPVYYDVPVAPSHGRKEGLEPMPLFAARQTAHDIHEQFAASELAHHRGVTAMQSARAWWDAQQLAQAERCVAVAILAAGDMQRAARLMVEHAASLRNMPDGEPYIGSAVQVDSMAPGEQTRASRLAKWAQDFAVAHRLTPRYTEADLARMCRSAAGFPL